MGCGVSWDGGEGRAAGGREAGAKLRGWRASAVSEKRGALPCPAWRSHVGGAGGQRR